MVNPRVQDKSLFLAMLFSATVLVMFLFAGSINTSEVRQENDSDEHRVQRSSPATLADVIKALQSTQALVKNLKAKVNRLTSKRVILLRGRDGRDGAPGVPGKDGSPGVPGSGSPGVSGRDGTPGTMGPLGPKGRAGTTGKPGARGSQGLKGDTSGGVQYVRWGRTTCPSGASLVYKGRMGGSHYSHTGGGANYVCLTESPTFGRYRDGSQGNSYMYGTEYEVSLFNPLSSNVHNHDALCAVCYVTSRGSNLMMPGTYLCPAGWTREYHGYLMSEHHGHARPSTFVCVDKDAESVPGSSSNLNGALLYPVEGMCGSLPCGPYVNGRELTCAVCTK